MWRVGAQVSREPPPPLPGGYTVGEQVYHTGAGHTFEDGHRLVHGEQGKVVGPARVQSCHKGRGVDVSFPGSKLTGSCALDQVRRRRRRRAATHSFPPHQSPSHTAGAVWAHR